MEEMSCQVGFSEEFIAVFSVESLKLTPKRILENRKYFKFSKI